MEQNAQNPQITVNIKAIENGMLVLESPESGQQFHWPLSKLPPSVNVGDCLSVILNSNSQLTANNSPTAEPDLNAKRQKLLEELIN